MTSKQCNSCKYHILVKELEEGCFIFEKNFMKPKNCNSYKNGKLNQAHKDIFKKYGKKYPFTEMK